MELVLGGDEGLASEGGNLGRDQLGEAGGRIQAGAHGGTAQSQLAKRLDGHAQQRGVALETGAPAGNLLAELDGRGVLQVRAAGLDNALVFSLEAAEGGDEQLDGGQQLVFDGEHSGDVHGGGEGVVG